jgi:succinyl-diaminopimelate desuccinylase
MDFDNQISFLTKLINCASVTNHDDGKSIDTIINILEPAGFECHKLLFSDENHSAVNLYAQYGSSNNNFCFAGHTDVVEPGDLNSWHTNPFQAEIKNDIIYGRGIVDMKGAISSFIAAAVNFIKTTPKKDFSISLLIGGDEETTSLNGTIKLLHWLKENQKSISTCIVGEPTNPKILGESVKIGRRGSINFILKIYGKQGHAAYPAQADNAATKIVNVLHHLKSIILDKGTKLFEPSNLEITNITINNNTTNIIPGTAQANFNIRYNDAYTSQSLIAFISKHISQITQDYELEAIESAEAFYTNDKFLQNIIEDAIKKVVQIVPKFNTAGGTSDARFIHKICPVAEFGLINETAHKVNEHCHLNDLKNLTEIYKNILINYFNK